MTAILIDVKTQEVKEVEHDDTLQNIYDLLVCRTFDVVRIDDVNSIFVDDEGILKDNLYFEYSASDRVFQLAGNGLILGVDDDVNGIFVDDEGLLRQNQLYFEYPSSNGIFQLAGNGLILGVDDEGNSISPTLTVEDVKSKVNFLPEGFKVEPYMEVTAWD